MRINRSDVPVLWYVHPYAGGPGIGRFRRPFSLAHHWRKCGVRATVFAPSFHHLLDAPQAGGKRLVEDVPFEFVPAPTYAGNGADRLWNMFAFAWRMYRSADTFSQAHGKPDVIISSSPHPYAFLATHALARKYSAMSVFEVRDLWPLSLVELAGVPSAHPLVRFTGWIERYAYRNADRVVSLLPLTQEYMVERGLAREKWVHIPNGIDPEELASVDKTHPSILKAQQWKHEDHVICIYAGALGRPNNMVPFIRAIAKRKAAGDVTLKVIIVGRGEQESELRTLVSNLGLARHVAMYDQIPKSSVIGLFEEVDFGFFAVQQKPLYRFGLSPNKVFDYMSSGLPILFAVKSGHDLVREANCGVTVSPDDPGSIAEGLRTITALPTSDRHNMGERGRKFVLENHTYAGLARTYLDCLNIHHGSAGASDAN